ncbi:MAG: PH domain-containing protein [Anaerolineae bacterium]|nr:PH domain-containing protein [Anaerolineae bacterium]
MPTQPASYKNQPFSDENEKTVFAISSSLMSYLGQIVIGLILTPVLIGLFFLLNVVIQLLSVRYTLTSQRLFIKTGLIARDIEEIELFRIKDVKVEQSVMQRILGYGTITIISNDETAPLLYLTGVSNPVKKKEQIRTYVRMAREHVRGLMLMN